MKRKLSAMLLAVLLLQTVSCAESSENTEAAADTRTTSFSFAYGLQYNNILGDLKGNDTGVGSYYQSKLKAADRLLEKTLADFEKSRKTAADSISPFRPPPSPLPIPKRPVSRSDMSRVPVFFPYSGSI